jgi:hypothetical protein
VRLPRCLTDVNNFVVAQLQPIQVGNRSNLDAPEPIANHGPLVLDLAEQPCEVERVLLAKVRHLECGQTTVAQRQHHIDSTLPAAYFPGFRLHNIKHLND